jgi:probable poly-beta-1,6-N-acetyl-D-glucosamine export protein
MGNNPEYFSEVVYLRAIAILAVISIHVSSYFTKMDTINFLTFFYMSIDAISSFAVPLFVCISGFVLYNKYQGSYVLKIFYKKRLLSVVPQYTIFSLLGILFIFFGYRYSERIWNFTPIDIFYQYFTGTAFYHLFFFIVIIQLYILYPIIERIFTLFHEKHKSLEFLILLFAVQILYEIFSIKDIFLIGEATLWVGYIFYFVLGIYIISHYRNYKNKVIKIQMHPYLVFSTLLFATILGIWNSCIRFLGYEQIPHLIYLYNLIFAIVKPLYYVLIFILCFFIALKFTEIIPNKCTRCMKLIGNYSFGIYLVHVFVLHGIALILFPKIGFDMNNWLFFPISYILVLTISLASVYIINKFPYHEYIIGRLR